MLQAKFFAALLTVLMLLGIAPVQSLPAETAAPQVPTEPASQTVTIEEAREIALAAVDIPAAEVVFSPGQLDRERGKLHWEIEFRADGWEYDFEIDATTGQVLRWEKEFDPEKPQNPQPPATEPVSAGITREEAKAIALAHAGLTADQVRGLKAEKDKEDGRLVYEVEFKQGRVEYEYEIHAETGAVLKWEKDLD